MMQKKTFKPILTPRYLPGSVSDSTARGDLAIYNKHRCNVFYAEAKIDATPPLMNPHNYIKTRRLVDDARRLNQIDKDNKMLLKKINVINRTTGMVDSFNAGAYDSTSKWGAHRTRMLQIARFNKEFYKRLVAAEPVYSKARFAHEWQENIHKMEHMAKYTLQMYLTKTVDQLVREQPSISGNMGKLGPRPLCFMEFRIKDGVHLGRIIIELYHDYVPITVQNFLSICKGENKLTYKNCPVHKILKGQYCEMGDITKGNGKGGVSIYGDTFVEENYILRHSKPGVLSTVRIGKKNKNNSQFGITFEAQEKLDGNRVVFGKVVKGMRTVYQIQDLGRKCGPPLDKILIENCGEYRIKSHKYMS